jgi:hypothetical protein
MLADEKLPRSCTLSAAGLAGVEVSCKMLGSNHFASHERNNSNP